MTYWRFFRSNSICRLSQRPRRADRETDRYRRRNTVITMGPAEGKRLIRLFGVKSGISADWGDLCHSGTCGLTFSDTHAECIAVSFSSSSSVGRSKLHSRCYRGREEGRELQRVSRVFITPPATETQTGASHVFFPFHRVLNPGC